jgi:hypothetical protein
VEELGDILRRLEPSLGPLSGEPQPLDGGITNRNFRATLGGVDYVIRQPGKDCWASTARPSGWQQRRPRGSASPRPSRRCSRTAW